MTLTQNLSSLVTLAPTLITKVVHGMATAGAAGGAAGAALAEDAVSPVTLDAGWSKVARLLVLAALAVVGSVGNVFFISSILIEEHLKQRGNALLVNIALADLLVTGLVFPTSAVVILAGLRDTESACNFHWILGALSGLVTLLTFTAVAVENMMRLCLKPSWYYDHVSACKITALIFFIWTISAVVVGLQSALPLGPDYCHRKFDGLFSYQMAVSLVLVLGPLVITIFSFLFTMWKVNSLRQSPNFKPPITYAWDYSLAKLNFVAFALYIAFWLPFGVVIEVKGTTGVSPRVLYHLAWFALSKSCFNNLLYCADRHFRNAYVNLFHYCFCKTTVALSRRPRPTEPPRPSGDVRVHIIPGYNMYSYTSPQRAAGAAGGAAASKPAAKRPLGAARPATSRANGREVYEL